MVRWSEEIIVTDQSLVHTKLVYWSLVYTEAFRGMFCILFNLNLMSVKMKVTSFHVCLPADIRGLLL